jgi:hypothetical protein
MDPRGELGEVNMHDTDIVRMLQRGKEDDVVLLLAATLMQVLRLISHMF